MEQRNKIAPTVWRLVCVLLFLVLLSVQAGVAIPARYSSSASASDSARVAVFASDIVKEELIISDLAPGGSKTMQITVSNKKNERVCEVAQSYAISAKAEGGLPIEVDIYNDEEDDTPADNRDANNNVVGTFAAAVEGTATYYVKVIWPEDENGYEYANEIGVVVVTVTATQID
ncbi:MAG: hypothetical protein IKA05_09250 [Clostridia bacterium]|nr:hypothetical protein [Clostridia bacterium]